MLTTIERILFLKEVPMFQELSIDQLRVLAEVAREVEVGADAVIARTGAFHDSMYVIVSGRVAIEEVHERASKRVSVKRLATLKAKEVFGELSIFDEQPFGHDVIAIEPTLLLAVSQQALTSLMHNQPELSRMLLKAMSVRLRQFMAIANKYTAARPKELVDFYDQFS